MKAGILIVLTLCIGATAQERSAANLSRVEGIVINATTGDPVADAWLELRPEGIPRPTVYINSSGSDGRFVLKDVAPARYRLTATRRSFIDGKYGKRQKYGEGEILDLATPHSVTDIVIRLTPGALITGTVQVEKGGSGLEGVAVILLERQYQADGSVTLSPAAETGSNDLGEYRMSEVPPGTYLMLAVAIPRLERRLNTAAFINQSDEPQMFSPTFYPNAIETTGALPIHVEPGARMTGIDFSLTRTRAFHLSGTVTDYVTGAPVIGEEVTLRPKILDRTIVQAQRETVRSDSMGDFEFPNVMPGNYVLAVDTSSPGFHSFTDSLDVLVVDRAVSGIRIVPRPYPSLSGQVIFEQGDLASNYHLSLRLTNTNTEKRGNEYDAGLNDDGSFELTNMEPGVYRISLMGVLPDVFIRSATVSSQDALGYGLDLRHDSVDHLRVVVSKKGGTVEGSVSFENKSPAADAQVLLLPDDRGKVALFRTVTADASGQFAIRGLSPGSYRLFAFEDLEPNIYFDPSFIEKYENRGTPIRIEEAGHSIVNLTAIQLMPPGALANALYIERPLVGCDPGYSKHESGGSSPISTRICAQHKPIVESRPSF